MSAKSYVIEVSTDARRLTDKLLKMNKRHEAVELNKLAMHATFACLGRDYIVGVAVASIIECRLNDGYYFNGGDGTVSI